MTDYMRRNTYSLDLELAYIRTNEHKERGRNDGWGREREREGGGRGNLSLWHTSCVVSEVTCLADVYQGPCFKGSSLWGLHGVLWRRRSSSFSSNHELLPPRFCFLLPLPPVPQPPFYSHPQPHPLRAPQFSCSCHLLQMFGHKR